MIATLLAAAATLAPSYAGQTDEGRRIDIRVEDRAITSVRSTVVRYECEGFGEVGPLRIRIRPQGRVDRSGRFSFVTGDRAQRVGVAGTLRPDGTARGRLRASGTIGTGERCTSPVVRFRAQP